MNTSSVFRNFVNFFSPDSVFLIIRVLLGQYQVITKFRFISYLVRLYCAILAVFIVKYGSFANVYIYYFSLAEYVAQVCLFQFVKEDYFVKYYSDLKSLCQNMGVVPILNTFLSRNILIIIFPIIVSKIFLAYGYYVHSSTIYIYLAYGVLLASLNLSAMMRTIVFDLHCGRTRLLRKSLENEFLFLIAIGRERVEQKIAIIQSRMIFYDSLLDNLTVAYKQIHVMVINLLYCL